MMESMYYILFLVEMLLFILICYFMFAEESTNKSPYMKQHIGNYMIAVPLIAVNFILLVLSAFGGYSLDYFVLQNVTTTPVYEMVSKPIVDYAVWAFVFFCLFLVHVLLLFKNVFDYMSESTFDERAYQGERRNM